MWFPLAVKGWALRFATVFVVDVGFSSIILKLTPTFQFAECLCASHLFGRSLFPFYSFSFYSFSFYSLVTHNHLSVICHLFLSHTNMPAYLSSSDDHLILRVHMLKGLQGDRARSPTPCHVTGLDYHLVDLCV